MLIAYPGKSCTLSDKELMVRRDEIKEILDLKSNIKRVHTAAQKTRKIQIIFLNWHIKKQR